MADIQPNQYPIKLANLNKDSWIKKVNATLITSFQMEKQNVPILHEWVALLERVVEKPLTETFADQQVTEFFFNSCFSQVCQKLISSVHFENYQVLVLSNHIIELSSNIYLKYLDLTLKYYKFANLAATIFNTDAQYFKTNNQLDPNFYAWLYQNKVQNNSFLDGMQPGGLLDIIKYDLPTKKATWSRAIFKQMDENGIILVEFLNDVKHATREVINDSIQIAPLGTNSKDFNWRMGLKQGDIIDCSQINGIWHISTIVKIIELEKDCKKAKVTYKMYDPSGDKFNERGNYYGMSDSDTQDQIDVTSPRIQPVNAVTKQREYVSSSIYNSDDLNNINDTNDHVMEYIGIQRLTFILRAQFCSGLLFRVVRSFIQRGGFQMMLKTLEESINGYLLSSYISAIGNVAFNLHRSYVKELIPRLKVVVRRHLLDENDAVVKSLTSEEYENIFMSMGRLAKRELANLCLKSETLKRRLQGLSELKDIIKFVQTSNASKIVNLCEWLHTNKIFEKLYVKNQHVQLIKKSTELLRFLLFEDALQIEQLQLIYSATQRGNYQTRISIYKLFEQVANSFKRSHVDFLIDQILESDINLLACQDLQLMHELSKLSSYSSVEKVMKFFEGLILQNELQPQLLDVSVKKYADIVVNNQDMVPYRKQIIKMFLEKLQTPQILIAMRVLACIFDNVGTGEHNKYDILDFLNEVRFNQVVLDAIKYHKQSHDYLLILEKLLHILQLVLGISKKMKLNLNIYIEYWELLSEYASCERWCGIINKLQQAIRNGKPQQLQEIFLKLVSPKYVDKLTKQDFQTIKNIFVNINCEQTSINILETQKNGKSEKVASLTRNLYQLKYYDKLLDVIYGVADQKVAETAIDFYNSLYITRSLEVKLREKYLQRTLDYFFGHLRNNCTNRTPRALRLIDIIIDESEKDCGYVKIKSLAATRKGELLLLDIINHINYRGNFYVQTTSYATLFDLRMAIAKQLKISWRQVKIVQKEELTDICNSMRMNQLNIKIDEPFKVSKRQCKKMREELIVKNILSPKAIQVFKGIFNKYSTNGLMGKVECTNFMAVCVNRLSTHLFKEGIINEDYDDDKDGYLTIKNFLKFYQDAARDQPSVVWDNLYNCGIGQDLKSFDNLEQDPVDIYDLPRYHLSQRLDFYEALFGLLDAEEFVAKAAWKMLERLQIYNVFFNETFSEEQSNQLKLLNIELPSKMLYCMYLFEYLLEKHPTQLVEEELQWEDQFQSCGGYQRLFQIYRVLECRDGKLKTTEQHIKELVLNMMSKYIAKSFPTSLPHNQANAVLFSQLEFSELLPLLIKLEMPRNLKGEFKIKQYKKILQQKKISQIKYQWYELNRKELVEVILQSLRKLWSQTVNIIQRGSQIKNCLSILLNILLNEDSTKLCEVLSELLCKSPSESITKQLYLFVCALCFFSDSGHQRIINCLLMFLKDDKVDAINDEYVKTITALITKYGFAKDNESAINILVSNVMNSTKQQVIQISSNLLCLTQNQHIDEHELQKIWKTCLFGDKIRCKGEGSRAAVYELLATVAKNKSNLNKYLLNLMMVTLNKQSDRLRVLSQNQLKNRSPYNYAGIKNIGSICYMISIIQQFYMNSSFRNLILRADDGRSEQHAKEHGRIIDENTFHQLQRLFAFLVNTQRMDYNPQDFCFSWKTDDGQPINVLIQQDAQQFTSMLLQRVEKSIKDTPFRKVIQCTYTGKTSNLLTCKKCQKSKLREEDFYSLTLEVKNYKILQKSLDKLIEGQTINDYYCDFCNERVNVVKKISISRCPNNLILHLQRNIFNLDTSVNEKINNKFEFPQTLNIKPYSLEAIQPSVNYKPEVNIQETETKIVGQQKNPNDEDYEYDLVGVVAHSGGAEFGHYYSFIKTQNGHWFEFNDSNICSFDLKNLEAECYGSITEITEGEFDWIKKENSKNANMLIYQKRKKQSISLYFTSEDEKHQVFEKLDLKQKQEEKQNMSLLQSISKQGNHRNKRSVSKEVVTVKNREVIRKDQERFVDTEKQVVKPVQIKVCVAEPISDYLPAKYEDVISEDNQLHNYQINVCSDSFVKFYINLLELNSDPNNFKQLLNLTQKLSFGVWITQPKLLKEMLLPLQTMIERQPSTSLCILKNVEVRNLFLESNDIDLRSSIGNLLLAIVNCNIKKYQLTLARQKDVDTQIVDFLDIMFSLLPTIVSKNWINFTQYFEFWKQFATKSTTHFDYLIRKECISHFYDYFMGDKSPLRIYTGKKYTIGSKYASPNFTPLLETANYLIVQLCSIDHSKLSFNDRKILSFELFNKIITESNKKLACSLVGTLCKDSLSLSQKVGFVLIRRIFDTDVETIQRYLNVVYTFVLINDRFKEYRLKWVLGMPTLSICSINKDIAAFDAPTIEERLYYFDSTLHMEQDTISILEKLYNNFSDGCIQYVIILKALLEICLADEFVFDYIINIPAPCLRYSRYIDFFESLIQIFIKGVSLENQFGNAVNELYRKFVDKIRQRQGIPISSIKLEKIFETKNNNDIIQNELGSFEAAQMDIIQDNNIEKTEIQLKSYTDQSDQSAELEIINNAKSTDNIEVGYEGLRNMRLKNSLQLGYIQANNQIKQDQIALRFSMFADQSDTKIIQNVPQENELKIKSTYHPYKFIYILTKSEFYKDLNINYHESRLIYIKTQPNGYTNQTLSNLIMAMRNKVPVQCQKTSKEQLISGFFLKNCSKDTYLVKWKYGCSLVKDESMFLWSSKIEKVQILTERSEDWPTWSLYE